MEGKKRVEAKDNLLKKKKKKEREAFLLIKTKSLLV